MSGWNIANWQMPVFLRVIAITLGIMGGVVGTIWAIVLFFTMIYNLFGETATVCSFFGSLSFAIISWVTWMTIEDKW